MLRARTLGKRYGGGVRPDRGAPPRPRRAAAGAALLAFALLLAGAGCAHKELLAPCSDYKAADYNPPPRPGLVPADYNPPPRPGLVPCDTPQQMHRPPWLTAAEPGTPAAHEG